MRWSQSANDWDRAFTICLSLFGSVVVVIIYVVLSVLIAWQVTLGLVVFALVIGLAMSRLYKKSYAAGESLAPLNAQLQSALNEQFAGAKFIKASAGGDRAVALIEPLVQKLGDVNARASAMPGTVRAMSSNIIGLIGLADHTRGGRQRDGRGGRECRHRIALFGRLVSAPDRGAVAIVFIQHQRAGDRGHQQIAAAAES